MNLKNCSKWTIAMSSLLIFASAGHAVFTMPQVVNFAYSDDGAAIDLESNDLVLNATPDISGFTKFDGSLGTLTAIHFTLNTSASYFVQLDVDAVVDESFGATFTADYFSAVDSFNGIDLGLTYNTGNGPTGSFILGDTASGIPMLGVVDELVSDHDDGSGFSFSSSDGGDFATSELTGSIFNSDSDYLESDFVGAGLLTAVSLIGIFQFDFEVFTDNVPEFSAFLEMSIAIDAGSVEMVYEYTPVPEPSVYALLLGCGALVICVRRKRK